jgi:hypothetical protein
MAHAGHVEGNDLHKRKAGLIQSLFYREGDNLPSNLVKSQEAPEPVEEDEKKEDEPSEVVESDEEEKLPEALEVSMKKKSKGDEAPLKAGMKPTEVVDVDEHKLA